MLGSSFQEGSTASGDMLEIQVTDVEPGVLYAALRWVYTDRVDADMPAQQLLQVSSLLAVTVTSVTLFKLNVCTSEQVCSCGQVLAFFSCLMTVTTAIATVAIPGSESSSGPIKSVTPLP